MKKNLIFLILFICSTNIFAISFPSMCIQSGGANNCIGAAYSDWVHSSSKGTITIPGRFKITEEDAIGKILALYPPENTPNGYVWYEYKANDEADRKITWAAESWFNQAKQRREAYDSTVFNLRRCLKDNQTNQTTCGGFSVSFQRTWTCAKDPVGIVVEYRKDIPIFSYNRPIYGPDSVTADKNYDDVSSKACIAPNLGPTKQCKGNPCSITTGNKFQIETDYIASNSLLKIQRTFNSLPTIVSQQNIIGNLWNFGLNPKISLWKYEGVEIVSPKPLASSESQKGHIFGTYTNNVGNTIYFFNLNESASTFPKKWFVPNDRNISILQLSLNDWVVEYGNKAIKEFYKNNHLVRVEQNDGQYYNLIYTNNLLSQAIDHNGRKLEFNYNSNDLITSITLPNNKQILYRYDATNRLTSVTRPGYGTKNYHYSESTTVAPSGNPNLLTGITDEIGKRYANYAYDGKDRGILTEHSGNSQKFTFNHSDNYTYVTDPYGIQWTYSKYPYSGTYQITNIQRQGIVQQQNVYDSAGNLTKKTEKGQTTTYSYDLSRNLEISRIEAVGTPQERTINTTWHSDFAKPTQIQEVSQGQVIRTIAYTYDAQGNALTKTITDPTTQETRTWRYEYNNFGQMTKQTTANGEITTYQYDETNGNLLSNTAANGIITAYSLHNADGQPTRITISTGQIIELIYDDAGRVIQQKQLINSDDLQQQNNEDGLGWWQQLVNAVYALFDQEQPYSEPDQKFIIVANPKPVQQIVNSYEYDSRGLLTTISLADGERIEYQYDDAHRLIEIKDQSGNRTVYTLNNNGDIIQTDVYGIAGQLEAKNQQVYDNFGRLQQTLGNNQQIQTLSYNTYDQQISDKNALNQSYSYNYDVLGRQIKEIDPLNQSSQYEYDALDQLKKVIDAKGGTTTYQYNAFGEITQQNSPDTGTSTYQYQNGKLLEKVDANQRRHRYQYDAQGRVTLQQNQYANGIEQYEDTSFIYGQTGNDQGKLVQANNKRAETTLSYNDLGLVRQKTIKYLSTQQNTVPQLSTYYSYSLGGKLKQVGLPSGNVINYNYDNKGQLIEINLNSQNFISNVQYSANGIKGWTYSQVGDQVQFQYDLDGRIQKIFMPNVYEKNYSYDVADRILAITDPNNSNISSSYKHDALSRLIEQNLATKTFKYNYDANSNRLVRNQIENGVNTTENYVIQTGNNHINSITQGKNSRTYTYLATGQITNDGVRSYTYNAQGRSEEISTGTSSSFNIYDAFGQRIQKVGSNAGNQTQTLFVYDENGQLLGEYTPQGEVIREYIWLENRLVGLRSYQYPNEILRVHTDHLGTPRAISDNHNQIVWRWEGDQFGDVLPTGNLIFPLRHVGQYYDAEVGLFYNYFRDYDPNTGRYIESDPIGLDGGLNTYGYVGANALSLVDPKGLAAAIPILGLGETVNLGLAISLIYNMPDTGAIPQSKPAICDVEPDDLCEQLVLAEAKAGAGYQIMQGEKMNDEPRLIAHYGAGPWIKKEHKKTCSNGRQKVIHYFHSLSSRKNVELKFKKR